MCNYPPQISKNTSQNGTMYNLEPSHHWSIDQEAVQASSGDSINPSIKKNTKQRQQEVDKTQTKQSP
jgi:hypothetical protein